MWGTQDDRNTLHFKDHLKWLQIMNKFYQMHQVSGLAIQRNGKDFQNFMKLQKSLFINHFLGMIGNNSHD